MTFITGYFHSNHGIMFNKESNFMSFICINDKPILMMVATTTSHYS